MKSAKTRLGFTGLVVCGAAVLVWGAADLYAWATTGQEVLAAYGEAESTLCPVVAYTYRTTAPPPPYAAPHTTPPVNPTLAFAPLTPPTPPPYSIISV